MANNGVKDPLMTGLPELTLPDGTNYSAQRKRYRRCKSAPSDGLPGKDHVSLTPVSKSILTELHPISLRVVIFLAIYLGIGTFCFFFVKHQLKGMKTDGILDSLYFCIVTMTTVGYGDLVPNSVTAKLLACVFVFTGMGVVGIFLSKAADYLVEKQEILLVKALNTRRHIGAMEMMKEMGTKKVEYKLVTVMTLLVVLIVIGTVFLFKVENLDLIDSFYCVCSTITTLGYGDKSFSTKGGRIFAVFWILTSTICVAQFFLYLAELNTERRQHALVKWVLTRRMTNLDLEAADLDGDGAVSAAEFIVFKLKEMGKISQEDIALVMEEFENLDFDQSGTLTVSDLELAQSSR